MRKAQQGDQRADPGERWLPLQPCQEQCSGRHEQERQRALQLQRELLLNVVKAHFPKLVRLARKQGSVIDKAKVLNDLIVKVSIARTMEEARQHLLAVDEGEEDM